MAKTAIKLSEEFVEIAREEGRLMHRSIAAQVEYWASIGRELEVRGALGPAGVRRLLHGQGSIQNLGEADDAFYVSMLAEKLEAIDGSDERPLNDLRAGGHPIASVDKKGKVVVKGAARRSAKARKAESR